MVSQTLGRSAELTLDELAGMTNYLSLRVGSLDRAYQAFQDGIARDSDWERTVKDAPIYLGSPFGRIWWEIARNDYQDTPEFVRAVDQALDESPIVPDHQFLVDLQARTQSLAP
jgi:hypothetical protein